MLVFWNSLHPAISRGFVLYGGDGEEGQESGQASEGGVAEEAEQSQEDTGASLNDPDAIRAALREAREEAAQRRVALREEKKRREELEARLKEIDDLEKSELEKAREAAQAEAQAKAQLEAQLRNERTNNSIVTEAVTMNFHDVADATALLDRSKIEYDETGQPTRKSVKAALEALVKAKPHLVGKPKKNFGSGDGAARGKDTTKKTWESIVDERAEKMVKDGGYVRY